MKPRRPATASCPRAVLEPAFFDRPADQVARDLLGKALLRRIGRNQRTFVITETEAYLGPHDLACHSARGTHRTHRSDVWAAGHSLYLPRLRPALDAQRGNRPAGIGCAAAQRRRRESAPAGWGPRLASPAPSMARRHNRSTGLWFEDRPASGRVAATARIGVDYAGRFWSRRKLRFVFAPSNFPPEPAIRPLS